MSTQPPFRRTSGGDRPRSDARFRFDGTTYDGHLGDTLAAAPLANGVRLLGRSFKYHRPRGLLSAGPEEPNGRVELIVALGGSRTRRPRPSSCSMVSKRRATLARLR